MMYASHEFTTMFPRLDAHNTEKRLFLQVKTTLLLTVVHLLYRSHWILFRAHIPHLQSEGTVYNGLTVFAYTFVYDASAKHFMLGCDMIDGIT